MMRSLVPARLDRLAVVALALARRVALGVAWVLDGLEVTIVGSIGARARASRDTLGLSATQIGWSGSLYLARRSHRRARVRPPGRPPRPEAPLPRDARLYFGATLAHRVLAPASGRFACSASSPARHRRRVCGDQLGDRRADPGARARPRRPRDQRHASGSAPRIGAAVEPVLLDPRVLGPQSAGAPASWARIGVAICSCAAHVPESPRWLLVHGRAAEAEAIVARHRGRASRRGHALPPPRRAAGDRARRARGLRDARAACCCGATRGARRSGSRS